MTPRTAAAALALCTLAACAHAPTPSTDRGYDAELTQVAYPFEVHFRDFTSQGQRLRMAYMDVQPTAAPNGKTVVLLHGKNFSGAYWERTVRALAERGYRVVVPDQVGFGKSSKPEHYQFTFQALATHTRDLLDALKVDRFVLVGHSMGGMLATRMALMFPERVQGLVLVNPIGLEDWKRVVPYRTVDENYQAELENTPERIREYMRQSYFGGEWKPEYEPLVDMLAGWTRGPDKARLAWVAALTTDMVFTQPVVHELPDVRVPTLLVIGQKDRTAIGKAWASESVRAQLGDYPALGRRAQAAIPDAQLVPIPDAGHLPQVEAFDAYLKALAAFVESVH